jgi:adenylate cyclase
LAEGGGVCISGSVYDEIANKLPLDCESLGEHALKNIEGPVRVYRVRPPAARDEAPPESTLTEAGPALKRSDTLSVAVLPFANMSDDPEQEHFTDGITNDIITDLSRIAGLTVIARSSTFTYKGTALKIPDVGRELGLEGSVRKVGEQVRITAQLVDAVTGHGLWAERYDRDLKDIFGVQDEISQKIAMALKVNLTAEDEASGAP